LFDLERLVTRAVLVDVAGVERALARLRGASAVPAVPNTWQITLGVLRMWHRMLFRSETVGTSARPVRPTWRARFFSPRPLRFPFLVAERAIAPLDFSGLLSGRERVIRHLLAAHHDDQQFAYDLEMLELEPGALAELYDRTRAITSGRSARAAYLRDLTVYDGYHDDLERAVARALAGDLGLSPEQAADPDISFTAYLAWCAAQPPALDATRRARAAGRWSVDRGLV
jgi:hypothetical protein